MKTAQQNQKRIKTPIVAYMGYLFESFFKRPFGYIVATIYLVYLAVIFLIVPSALHFEPLAIWNIAAFNMPIINLFFISATSASIAVAVYRTSREDGMDLNLSAKPLTKGITVMVKTTVYLIIMLVICLLSVAIVSLTKPIFGEYNLFTNITGIVTSKYKGLMLSMFVGNLVNMLLFGGIAIFICMIGGQVATIVGTVGTVILMSILSFIFPQVIKNANQILSDKYGTEIYSYSAPTLHQYENPDEKSELFKYATINCFAPDGEERYHFDTKEYWDKATKESGRKQTNYVEFAKQLTRIFDGFGMEDQRIEDASKMMIGLRNMYNYEINADSHVTLPKNIEEGNYPIGFYYLKSEQGMYIPKIAIIGHDMNLNRSNWYLQSTLHQYDFNSCVVLSDSPAHHSPSVTPAIVKDYGGRSSFRINELQLIDDIEKQFAIDTLYGSLQRRYDENEQHTEHVEGKIPYQSIVAKYDEEHPDAKYDALAPIEKFKLVSKTIFNWVVITMTRQQESVTEYWKWKYPDEPTPQFPYSSHVVIEWQKDIQNHSWPREREKYDFTNYCYLDNQILGDIWNEGAIIDYPGSESEQEYTTYAYIDLHGLAFTETYNNLYTYTVENFFNVAKIIAGWSIVAGVLFAGSVVIYKKTDFK